MEMGLSCLHLRQQWEEEFPLQHAVVVQLPTERMELERSSLQQLALTGMKHFHFSSDTVYDSMKLTIVQHSWKKSHNILIVKQLFIQRKTGKFISSIFYDNLSTTLVSKTPVVC